MGGSSPLPPSLLPSLLRGGGNASLDPEPLDCPLAGGALLDAALLGWVCSPVSMSWGLLGLVSLGLFGLNL